MESCQIIALSFSTLLAVSPTFVNADAAASATAPKPRLVVMTDIGGDRGNITIQGDHGAASFSGIEAWRQTGSPE